MHKKLLTKILLILAIISIIISSILGARRELGEVKSNLYDFLPSDIQLEEVEDGKFAVYSENVKHPISFLVIEKSNGYGGSMDIAVMVDTQAAVTGINILKHRETPSFVKKVEKKHLIKNLKGKRYSDNFTTGDDIDAISGATYTAEAIIDCARQASRRIAGEHLGIEIPDEAPHSFRIGIPEIVLLLLYAIALISIYTGFKYRKQLRWVTMTVGLVVLGFWFAVPLSLSKINTFLLGYWPDWHTELYWYILVFGFVITVLSTRKNIYCNWICPVGCIQDGLGLIGGARPRFSKSINKILQWIPRIFIWSAVCLALYFRNPVKLNYEIFGVSLSLTGSSYLFVMTAVFFVASLFIKRPWCNYLCPVSPLYDLLSYLSPWKKINKG